jgi:hypothetical protein
MDGKQAAVAAAKMRAERLRNDEALYVDFIFSLLAPRPDLWTCIPSTTASERGLLRPGRILPSAPVPRPMFLHENARLFKIRVQRRLMTIAARKKAALLERRIESYIT